MRRRLALAASSASILSLILAATAFAGGWANAVMDTPPDDPAGTNQPVTLGFTLLQHGETPVDWGVAQIVLTNDETGQQIVANATPSGPIGHWAAEVTLPAEGSWSYQVAHPDLEITIMGGQPISVGGPQEATTGGTAAIGMSPALLAGGGFLALLGMVVLAGAVVVVRRSRQDEVRA
ncbi:MAG TPA: hypothetical protein VFQ46_09245 [Candidatus Limnocylindria bacterium]|nr:hypothetical protein [Candidatus Limnocylindria bacterium]